MTSPPMPASQVVVKAEEPIIQQESSGSSQVSTASETLARAAVAYLDGDEDDLPPTKIKRCYKCEKCGHNTWNPRLHLTHKIQVHGEKIKMVKCPLCVYACQYRQKLNRHLKLVHKILPTHSWNINEYPPFDNLRNAIFDSSPDNNNNNNNNNINLTTSIDNYNNNCNASNKTLPDGITMNNNPNNISAHQWDRSYWGVNTNTNNLSFNFSFNSTPNNDYTTMINAYLSRSIPFSGDAQGQQPVDLSFPEQYKNLLKNAELLVKQQQQPSSYLN